MKVLNFYPFNKFLDDTLVVFFSKGMGICSVFLDSLGNQQAHAFVSSFTWPKKWQTSGMTGRKVFEKRTANSGDLKCSASELLSVYGTIRLMVLIHCPDYDTHDEIAMAVRSFIAGCKVLDID